MIPIGDSPKRIHPPIITKALIIVNVALFFGAFLVGIDQLVIIKSFGVIPLEITQQVIMDTPISIQPGWKLLTSLFIHGGFWHLAGNMLFLWIFADNVEDKLGKILFPLFYIGGGVLASLVQIYLTHPSAPEATVPMVGASGAISCVMGAYLVLFPKAKVDLMIPLFLIFPIVVSVPASFFLIFWFFTQLIQASAGVPGVGWLAHIGGFAIGWIVIKVFYPKNPKNNPPYEIIYPS